MLYDEFIKGTGCKENDHNYKVYKDLEIMYMNSDMSKAQIYEYGKKLVDNSKSEKEIEIENDINRRIEEKKENLSYYKDSIKFYTMIKDNSMIKYFKEESKRIRAEIRALKWVLNN